MVGYVERVNRWLHLVAGAALVALALLTAANIVGRRFLGAPVPGSIELTEMGMILVVFLGFAYSEHRGDHVTIDLVYTKLGRRGRLVLDLFGQVLTLGLLVLLAWYVSAYAGRLSTTSQTTGVLGLPVAAFAYVAMVGLVAFGGAVLANLLLLVSGRRDLGSGPEDVADGMSS